MCRHVFASAACVAAALPCWAFAAADAPRSPVSVTVTADGCQPSALTVPPGRSTFRITNASAQPVGWVILSGTTAVDPRAKIVPGLTMALTTALEPGQYQVTCGLRSNPKAMLLVEEDSLAVVGPAPAPNLALQIAAYKLYVRGELIALVGNTRALVDAVKAGKLSEARRAYAPAHQRYERVEPVATLFDDLDTRMDSRADDFARKEADPNFMGFHRLEKALFADRSTQGMAPVADRLMADTLDLQKRVDDLAIPARVMVGGPDELIEDVASTKMLGQEDRYSRTDLWDLQANIDGAHKIYALLQPQIHGASPTLDQSIRSTIARVDALLAKYRVESDGFESYDKLSKQDRATLRGQVAELAGDFARLRDTLGLD